MNETKQTEEKYNGWSNHETWLVNLWLTNEQETNNALINIALDKSFELDIEKADKLKEFVQDLTDLDEPSFKQDLINSSLSNVNWLEIIRSVEE